MNNRQTQIDRFFESYEKKVNEHLRDGGSDTEKTTQFFAESFIGASPLGVRCGKNDEYLKEMISQGYAFYKNIGITSMHIQSKTISFLDNYHTMVNIQWRCSFTKKDQSKGEIAFAVIYLLQAMESENKIFAWIAGDEQKALEEIGLI